MDKSKAYQVAHIVRQIERLEQERDRYFNEMVSIIGFTVKEVPHPESYIVCFPRSITFDNPSDLAILQKAMADIIDLRVKEIKLLNNELKIM